MCLSLVVETYDPAIEIDGWNSMAIFLFTLRNERRILFHKFVLILFIPKKRESSKQLDAVTNSCIIWSGMYRKLDSFYEFFPSILILLLMIDSTSDQKDIPWLYFISSTSLVMSPM